MYIGAKKRNLSAEEPIVYASMSFSMVNLWSRMVSVTSGRYVSKCTILTVVLDHGFEQLGMSALAILVDTGYCIHGFTLVEPGLIMSALD